LKPGENFGWGAPVLSRPGNVFEGTGYINSSPTIDGNCTFTLGLETKHIYAILPKTILWLFIWQKNLRWAAMHVWDQLQIPFTICFLWFLISFLVFYDFLLFFVLSILKCWCCDPRKENIMYYLHCFYG
jgi:hypothetical protein